MIRPRLRTRLTIWFADSVLIILAPFLTGIVVFEQRSMRAALDHHLSEDLEVASQMLVLHGAEVRWRLETDTDPGYDAGPRRWVEVYREDGRPLFLRGAATLPAISSALPPPTAEPTGYQTVRTPAGAYVRTKSADRLLGSMPVRIRVARPEDELRQQLRGLVLLCFIGAPLAVLAAAVAGHVISGRMLRPLVRMADRARSIGADQLSERLPIENANDEMGQLAIVFNQTFERLQASFERLKQFTADASHELRTPLTAIRSVGEVGLREARTPGDYQEIIGSMLEEADRLARVVDTLLTLSRWESQRAARRPEDLDWRGMVRDVAAQLSVLAEERGVTIAVDAGDTLTVSADPFMVRQAITNVLDNAIKFTRPGGSVHISAVSDAREHHVIVDDEGPGIPADQREQVLERFYRIDGRHDRGSGGVGLGLAIVHRAMTANGGRIVLGASPAGGTRVTLALPRAASATAQSAQA